MYLFFLAFGVTIYEFNNKEFKIYSLKSWSPRALGRDGSFIDLTHFTLACRLICNTRRPRYICNIHTKHKRTRFDTRFVIVEFVMVVVATTTTTTCAAPDCPLR